MTASSRHYCTVCRSWYRSWSLHGSSRTHMNNLRKLANPASSHGRKAGRRALGAKRRSKVRQGDELVSVDDYYRNPPTPPWAASIRDRVWYVHHYFRRRPFRFSREDRAARRAHR